jgi:type IV secretory pathway VirB4 component
MATPGAGKSYFVKLLALRSLLAGVDVLVVDPEGEYRALCAAAGGQHVRLAATSPRRINPFDLPLPDDRGAADAPVAGGDGGEPLAEQVAALVGLLEALVATPAAPLTPDERAVLDRALFRTYAAAGITADPATHARPVPLLADLLAGLTEAGGATAAALAARLDRYVSGSLAGLFAGPTNVTLDRRLVVFDLEALDPSLRPAAVHLVTALVWRELRRALRPRLLVVDEAWSLLQYPEGGAFLAGLARRARKRYLGLVTVSQDVPEFLRAPHGQIVLRTAATKLLLKQDPTAIDEVAAALRLSPDERRLLLGAARGEGLLCSGPVRRPVQILACAAEHALVTTAPAEVAAPAPRPPDRPAAPPDDGRGRAGRPDYVYPRRPAAPAGAGHGRDHGYRVLRGPGGGDR